MCVVVADDNSTKSILLEDITKVLHGKKSKVLQHEIATDAMETACFSIVATTQNLHLEADNDASCHQW